MAIGQGALPGAAPRPAGPSAPASFILGPARSGTSLLYKALCLHPDASYISNWVARYPRLPVLAGLDRLARRMPSSQRRVWFSDGTNAYVYGQRRRVRDRVFPMPVEGEPVYTHSGAIRPGGEDPRAVDPAVALPEAFEAIRRWGGGSQVISKRIANNLRVELLADAFPAGRFVNLIRDGRPVALSLSKVDWWLDSYVWWYEGSPRRWASEGGDPFELCARNWVEEVRAIRSGLDAVDPGRVMHLRYEDLLADPIPTLEEVAVFVGLEPNARWHAALGQIRFGGRTDAWRSELPADVASTITEIQREELGLYGYAI